MFVKDVNGKTIWMPRPDKNGRIINRRPRHCFRNTAHAYGVIGELIANMPGDNFVDKLMAALKYLDKDMSHEDIIKILKHHTGTDVKKCGEGVQRAAYRVNDWVVKENTGGFGRNDNGVFPDKLRDAGFCEPLNYKVNDWVIQEFVTPFWFLPGGEYGEQHKADWARYKAMRDNPLVWVFDCHAKNVGLAKDGRIVCFDW
jgi:hypothetical protein